MEVELLYMILYYVMRRGSGRRKCACTSDALVRRAAFLDDRQAAALAAYVPLRVRCDIRVFVVFLFVLLFAVSLYYVMFIVTFLFCMRLLCFWLLLFASFGVLKAEVEEQTQARSSSQEQAKGSTNNKKHKNQNRFLFL